MTWEVRLHDAFEAEFAVLEPDVQTELLAVAKLLSDYGPLLGRPYVDTLNGSKHANMKEMRFSAADGEWRTAFAFDPERKAILLVAGDKSGGSQKRSEEHTSELQSLMPISYAVFCLKKKNH